jgi:hypothetical protein
VTLKQALDRYGVAAAVVVALGLLIVLLPGNVEKKSNVAAGDDTTQDGVDRSVNGGEGATDPLGGASTTLPGGSLSTGGTGGSANGNTGGAGGGTAASASVAFGTGPHCRPDGRQVSIERIAPPCANWLSKDNGGATSMGVTKDKILVVRYVAQSDPATDAILKSAKLSDDDSVVKRAYQALFKYFNQHWETYGREVVFQDFPASAPSENDEAAKADAVKIATQIKPFAVWGGPKAFATEIVSRGMICICTTTLSSEYYQSLSPYMFGSLPTSTEYSEQLGEYIGKKLNNRPAQFVGPGFSDQQKAKRKFGLIYLEGTRGKVDPEGRRAKDSMIAAMAKYGARFGDNDVIGYTYDPGRNQQDITTMMARLRGDGVTSVLMFADPLSPILITGEATRQQYYPEWIITGSGLTDTTSAARLYDQAQWQHAFGISPLWVTWNTPNMSGGYREAHHGDPSLAPGDEGVLINIYNQIPRVLFTGIQMAGPKLTPQSFAAGMFAYPKSGGTASTPLQYFTRQYPTAIKDFVEVYYDVKRQGADERGLMGPGMVMKMHGGKRFLNGQWDSAATQAFNDPSALTTSDDPAMGGDPPHEQDGHKHTGKCLSCS